MKRLILFVLLFSPVFTLAAFESPCEWIGGEYRGTDLVDGGASYRTFIEIDGVCTMRGGDTYHGPCAYGVPAVLTSELENESFNTFVGNWDLDCQAAPTDVSGDRFLAVRYIRDESNNAVTEQLLDPVTGAELSRPPIVFYRVSE